MPRLAGARLKGDLGMEHRLSLLQVAPSRVRSTPGTAGNEALAHRVIAGADLFLHALPQRAVAASPRCTPCATAPCHWCALHRRAWPTPCSTWPAQRGSASPSAPSTTAAYSSVLDRALQALRVLPARMARSAATRHGAAAGHSWDAVSGALRMARSTARLLPATARPRRRACGLRWRGRPRGRPQ